MRIPSSRVRSTLVWLALIGLFALLEWNIPVGDELDEGPEQGSFLSHPTIAAGVHRDGSGLK
jgi:hypothetical protein